jgi:hypothetical protein
MTIRMVAGKGVFLDTPAGEAHVAWDMSRRDQDALDAGVAISLRGTAGRLRRDRKALVLEGPDGHMATVRPNWLGRFAVEDARGVRVMRVKGTRAGWIGATATFEDVALALLVLASGAHLPKRGGGGALTPFG